MHILDCIHSNMDRHVCCPCRGRVCHNIGHHSTAVLGHYPRAASGQRVLGNWLYGYGNTTACFRGQYDSLF